MLQSAIAAGITTFARVLTGAQARWVGCAPEVKQRIYFANHRSHADFVLIWAVLPAYLRALTRPVAGADYWEKSALRRYLIHEVFNGVLVDRDKATRSVDPLSIIFAALDRGDSLIVFPEGTRCTGDEMLPFKSGIYHVARQRPRLELVPVRIENLNRVMPKGEVLPVPLLCSITFGRPLRIEPDEDKGTFLARARQSIMDMKQA